MHEVHKGILPFYYPSPPHRVPCKPYVRNRKITTIKWIPNN